MFKGKHLEWKDENGESFRPVALTGTKLLSERMLNKSTAFSYEERDAFELNGLLPPRVQTFEDQLARVYEGFKHFDDDVEKYQYLRSLQDRNETLFYALVSKHIVEMAPIIYTPTVGKACQQFSHRFQKTRGLYISEHNVDMMATMAENFDKDNIKIIVVTDSQSILGIGDQGIGGMGIPIGKLSLYTLGAGIHPASCLPITLDVGTNNTELLEDPMYLGIPKKRLTGNAYKAFIAKFVEQVKLNFPSAVLQWEDFSKSNAYDNLLTYENYLPSFNDDIQGTGSVVLAGILAAMKIKKEHLVDQTYVIYGAGAGGVGVADQIYAGLLKEGCDKQDARNKIFILDSKGLVFDDRENLEEYKKRYAKPATIAETWKVAKKGQVSLLELLDNHKITVLLGTSGIEKSFTQDHVNCMLKHDSRPVIMPLSNPTANCEALPEDLYNWSNGQAIVATGSPFEDVTHNENKFRIGQGNNVFVFPGIGLAAIASKTQKITLDMFTTASYALAGYVKDEDLDKGCVYPSMEELRQITIHVALKIMEQIKLKEENSYLNGKNVMDELTKHIWEPVYLPYRKV